MTMKYWLSLLKYHQFIVIVHIIQRSVRCHLGTRKRPVQGGFGATVIAFRPRRLVLI